jgi:hypothetical protein
MKCSLGKLDGKHTKEDTTERVSRLPPFYSQDVQVMYQKIMTAKLVIPETISSDAASLLRGMACPFVLLASLCSFSFLLL